MAQGSAVRIMVAGAVALVVGLGLGGLAPRAQIRALEAQVDELKDQSNCATRGIGRELASAFQGRPMAAALEEDEMAAIDRAKQPEPEPDEEPESGVKWNIDLGEGNEEVTPETVEEGLQLAKDAMAMRKAQARAALDEQVGPSEDQQAQIDGALDQMNSDLKALADGFVATIQDGQEPSRRDAMIFAADTLDVLLDADDAIWGSLTDEQRAMVEDEAIDPMAHIDPDLLDTFLELDR